MASRQEQKRERQTAEEVLGKNQRSKRGPGFNGE